MMILVGDAPAPSPGCPDANVDAHRALLKWLARFWPRLASARVGC